MSFLVRRAVLQSLTTVAPPIDSVFSVDLWSGNDLTRDIASAIDGAANDSLVWIRRRNSPANHVLVDSVRGATNVLYSSLNIGESAQLGTLTSYNNTGYVLGGDDQVNSSGNSYVGWQFREAPKFFDIVTYTGDGVPSRQIPHSLGTQAGLAFCKLFDATENWTVQHRSAPAPSCGVLNSSAAFVDRVDNWGTISMDDSHITVGDGSSTNLAGSNYIMYIFAHDPSPQGVIQCGKYIGNGLAGGPEVTLGWRPQYILIKPITGVGSWTVGDTSRGMGVGNEARLFAELPNTESTSLDYLDLLSTGFKLTTNNANYNSAGVEYAYMAIKEV